MGLAVAERLAMRGMNVVVADFAEQAILDAATARISKSLKSGRRAKGLRNRGFVPASFLRAPSDLRRGRLGGASPYVLKVYGLLLF